MNQDIGGRRSAVDMRMRDGRAGVVLAPQFSMDSVIWSSLESQERSARALADVESFSFESTRRGLLDGTLIGAAVGAIFMAAIVQDSCSQGCEWQSGALIGVLSGGTWGALIGAAFRSTVRYELTR
jgi:hypothetical protein